MTEHTHMQCTLGFLGWLNGKKNPSANGGDSGSISELGKYPGEGNNNPLQYSCLENSMDREPGSINIFSILIRGGNWDTEQVPVGKNKQTNQKKYSLCPVGLQNLHQEPEIQGASYVRGHLCQLLRQPRAFSSFMGKFLQVKLLLHSTLTQESGPHTNTFYHRVRFWIFWLSIYNFPWLRLAHFIQGLATVSSWRKTSLLH